MNTKQEKIVSNLMVEVLRRDLFDAKQYEESGGCEFKTWIVEEQNDGTVELTITTGWINFAPGSLVKYRKCNIGKSGAIRLETYEGMKRGSMNFLNSWS